MKELEKRIHECELAYSMCFSNYHEEDNVIRYEDKQLTDMYYHNFTFIKHSEDEEKLRELIHQEINLRKQQNYGFCMILLAQYAAPSLLAHLKYKPDVSLNGYYVFDESYLEKLKQVLPCDVKQVTNQAMIEDVLYCDLQHDEQNLGEDFCTRRAYRRGEVYLAKGGVDSYVCYDQSKVVGNCDLFMHEGVAKIEDFAVIPSQQRKGYGTAILKALIEVALKNKCHTIYLVADEEDTAKQMYIKLGFYKVSERSDLYFKL